MITVREAYESFMLAKQADGLKPATLTWYQYTLLPLRQALAGVPLAALTADHLRRYVIGMRAQVRSHENQRGHIRAMKALLSWAWQEYEMGGRCPADRIKIPASRWQTPNAIEIADVRLMLKACLHTPQGYRDRAILLFLTDTGCRAAGLLGLTPEDVDLTRRLATLREKGSKERNVPFTIFTARAIREWLTHRPVGASQLFCAMRFGRHGTEMTYDGLRLLLNRLKRKAGIKGRVNPHSFRHAFARHYLSVGGDLATLSQLLGHSDVSTTANFYTRYSVDELSATHSRFSPVGQMYRKESRDD